MSVQAIKQLFSNVNGNAIISIDTSTVPALTGGKSNPMQGQIRKVMIGANVMVFTNKNSNGYENMVNRRLEKEGMDPKSFTVGPRTWGERIEGTPFVEHNGQTYLEVIFLQPGKPKLMHGDREISVDAAVAMGYKETVSEGEQGGLKNKVSIRTFKAESLTAVTINGDRHQF